MSGHSPSHGGGSSFLDKPARNGIAVGVGGGLTLKALEANPGVVSTTGAGLGGAMSAIGDAVIDALNYIVPAGNAFIAPVTSALSGYYVAENVLNWTGIQNKFARGMAKVGSVLAGASVASPFLIGGAVGIAGVKGLKWSWDTLKSEISKYVGKSSSDSHHAEAAAH